MINFERRNTEHNSIYIILFILPWFSDDLPLHNVDYRYIKTYTDLKEALIYSLKMIHIFMFFEIILPWTSVKLVSNVEYKVKQGNTYQHIAQNCLYFL